MLLLLAIGLVAIVDAQSASFTCQLSTPFAFPVNDFLTAVNNAVSTTRAMYIGVAVNETYAVPTVGFSAGTPTPAELVGQLRAFVLAGGTPLNTLFTSAICNIVSTTFVGFVAPTQTNQPQAPIAATFVFNVTTAFSFPIADFRAAVALALQISVDVVQILSYTPAATSATAVVSLAGQNDANSIVMLFTLRDLLVNGGDAYTRYLASFKIFSATYSGIPAITEPLAIVSVVSLTGPFVVELFRPTLASALAIAVSRINTFGVSSSGSEGTVTMYFAAGIPSSADTMSVFRTVLNLRAGAAYTSITSLFSISSFRFIGLPPYVPPPVSTLGSISLVVRGAAINATLSASIAATLSIPLSRVLITLLERTTAGDTASTVVILSSPDPLDPTVAQLHITLAAAVQTRSGPLFTNFVVLSINIPTPPPPTTTRNPLLPPLPYIPSPFSPNLNSTSNVNTLGGGSTNTGVIIGVIVGLLGGLVLVFIVLIVVRLVKGRQDAPNTYGKPL